jgi:hypothetical protein
LKNPFNSPPPSTSSNLKNIAQKNITYKQSEKIRKAHMETNSQKPKE